MGLADTSRATRKISGAGFSAPEPQPGPQAGEQADAGETPDKLADPGGPLVLRLVEVERRSHRAALLWNADASRRHLQHQQFGATAPGTLRGRADRAADSGAPLWG